MSDAAPSRRTPHATAYGRVLHQRASTSDRDDPFLHLGHWDLPGRDEFDLPKAQRRLDDELQRLAELEDGQRLLDVACGVGGTLASVASRFAGIHPHGIDVDPGHLAAAHRRLLDVGVLDRAALCLANACSLPFVDASFDRVLCVEAAFHFTSRERFFRETMRVLRPGGLLVMSDIVPGPLLREFEGTPEGESLARRIERGLGPWPDFWGKEGLAVELAARAGLVTRSSHDASVSTLPSYRCFVPPSARTQSEQLCSMDDALLALEALQADGRVRVTYQVFQAQR